MNMNVRSLCNKIDLDVYHMWIKLPVAMTTLLKNFKQNIVDNYVDFDYFFR